MREQQTCAVCGQGGYWVGWVGELGENRCINHLPVREGSATLASMTDTTACPSVFPLGAEPFPCQLDAGHAELHRWSDGQTTVQWGDELPRLLREGHPLRNAAYDHRVEDH